MTSAPHAPRVRSSAPPGEARPSSLQAPLRRPSRPEDPSDEALLQALAEGRGHAFDLLVARHGARVRSYLGHLVRDRSLAEDLTQEVFLKVLTRAHTREPGRSFLVWLLRVARNEALDHLRRRGLHQRLVESVRSGVDRLARRGRRQPARPEQKLARDELYAALDAGLAELPETQRSVFLLRERDELSYEEIAAVLECSPKTVSTRLHRARLALREHLAEHLGETP